MKTKIKLLAPVAIMALFIFSQAKDVKAGPSDHDLPSEDDIFWQVTSVMATPTDTAACEAKIDEMAVNGDLLTYINNHQDELMREGDPQGGEWEGGGPTPTEMAQGFKMMCTMLAQMPLQMQTDMANEGVTSSLFDAPNWHSVSGLYFQKTGEGRISFTQNIDFLTYRFFRFMNNFDSMVKMEDGFISLNPSMITDVKNYGAVLTMYGLNFSEIPDIYVDGKKAGDSDVGDISYNANEGSLTFTAKHWSSYRAVEKGSKVKAMSIKKLATKSKVIRYNANKNTFRVKVKGRNLKPSSDQSLQCTLGFEKATKVSVSKSGKTAYCVFPMSYFSETGTYPLTLTIPGKGEVSKANAVRIR